MGSLIDNSIDYNGVGFLKGQQSHGIYFTYLCMTCLPVIITIRCLK